VNCIISGNKVYTLQKGLHISNAERYGSNYICLSGMEREMSRYVPGMFAFVIWDKKQQTLFAARDRVGVKPFFYYRDNSKFIFGSESKPFCRTNHSTELSTIQLYVNIFNMDTYLRQKRFIQKYANFRQRIIYLLKLQMDRLA